MSNIYDKSSLVLIPSGTKTGKVYSQKPVSGDGDFTFTRSSAATRVNADGNIEKETQNLLLQSNSFDTTWNPQSGITLTANQAGYDGTNDAWKLEKNASSYRNIAISISVSGVYTTSLYAKAGTLNLLTIRDGSNQYARFYLNTGTYTLSNSPVSGAMVDVGNGWYRCSVTMTTSNPTIQIYPDWNQTTAGYIYIQDAQLEQGLVARDYIETTTTAVEGGITDNVPRLDYTDSSCPALLLEPQRTNKESNSELLGTYSNSIIRLVNDTTSPEGLVNANKIVEAAATARHEIYSDPISFNGNLHTISFFAKADERRYVSAFIGGDPAYGGVTFDLQTGTISQTSGGTTADVVDYGNNWYRCSFTTNYPSSSQVYLCMRTADNNVDVQTYAGDGTSGFYIWGLQVEAGSYATSYIPTYGSSVTRVKEVCEVTSAEDLIGQTEGTIAGEFNYDSGEPTNRLFSIAGADWNTIGSIRFDIISLKPQATIRANGGEPAKIIGTQDINVGTLVKFAVVYTSTTLKMFVNGSQIGSTATLSGSLPSTLDEIRINALGGSFVSDTQNNQLNPYKQALVFKTALTDQEAIDLTTI